jgi:hypothetical protein
MDGRFSPYEPWCSWIATCDRLELVKALPVVGAAVSLSRVAWLLSDVQSRRRISPPDNMLPWRLSSDGSDEALAIQRAAIARGDKPMRLGARYAEVERDALWKCFGSKAVAALLLLLARHDIAVSGVPLSGGERVTLDRLLLSQLAFSLRNDAAWTHDGAREWRALAATRPAQTARAPSRPPEKRTVQGELARWYSRTYPSGHPAGRKLDTLAVEAAGMLGRTISTRTLRRAVADARKAGARTNAAN